MANLIEGMQQHCFRKLNAEKQEADNETVNNQKELVWAILIKDYQPDEIFNSDETGLYHKALPEHTLIFKNESAAGNKN